MEKSNDVDDIVDFMDKEDDIVPMKLVRNG